MNGRKAISTRGHGMKTKSKVWLGVGAFVVVGTSAAGGAALLAGGNAAGPQAQIAPATDQAGMAAAATVVGQPSDHGQDAGGGGEAKGLANLPPPPPFPRPVP